MSDKKSQDDSGKAGTNFEELERKLSDAIKIISELKQGTSSNESVSERIFELERQNKKLEQRVFESTKANQELEKKFKEVSQLYNELRQERLLLENISDEAESKMKTFEQKEKELEVRFAEEKKKSLEKEQEKLLLEDELQFETKQKHEAVKKYYKVIIVSAIAIAVVTGTYSYFFAELAGEKYRVEDLGTQNSGYTIQNLRGDTIQTWLSWRLVAGDVLHVNILNADKYEPEKIEAIKTALLSEEAIEIDNSLLHKGPKGTVSTHYLGWLGAMKNAAEGQTQLYIPTNIELVEARSGEGDITIELVNHINQDGFTGWANNIADEAQNQILKTRITIFDADGLTPRQLEAVIRHELGHAFGLAHSTAPEDLMFPTMKTEFPYISECDVDSIIALYDGSKMSEVVCEI